MTAASLDLDLVNERNTRLLRAVRAERLGGRPRTNHGPRDVARRMAKLFRRPEAIGQKTAAKEA